MMKSMTAYAHKVEATDSYTFDLTISSVNSRYSELNCRLSDYFSSKRWEIERIIREKIGRGKVVFSASCTFNPEYVAGRTSVNYDLIERYSDELRVRNFGVTVSLGDILRLPGVLDTTDASMSDDEWKVFSNALHALLDLFTDVSLHEGDALRNDMTERIKSVETMVDTMQENAGASIEEYKELLLKRIDKLELRDIVDDERLYKEVSYYAEQTDYTEELVRLRSHIAAFCAMIDDDTVEKNKRMTFLLQELNREINTAGSKCRNAAIAQTVVKIKEELEKIREQVQNVW